MITLAAYMNPRLFFYRGVARALCQLFRRSPPEMLSRRIQTGAQPGGFWFHASSVGELEGLLPLIQECAARQKVSAVSVWSHSGDAALLKLRSELNVPVLRAPHEGDWIEQLQIAAPVAVVTYRYEAWPDLWASCSLQGIPLLLIGARMRTSLRVVSRILRVLGVSFPKLGGTVFDSREIPSLTRHFPQSRFLESPNPRWQRAWVRVSGEPSLESRRVAEKIAKLSRPVVFLSQIWESDFDHLGLDLGQWAGGVVLFPHSLDRRNVSVLEQKLAARNIAEFLVVEESGVLAELYRFADCVYVGGGFERGIHSVIEPACAGVPIACGPMRVEEFEETRLLLQRGQLRVLSSAADWAGCVEAWKTQLASQKSGSSLAPEFGELPSGFWWGLLHSQAFVDLETQHG